MNVLTMLGTTAAIAAITSSTHGAIQMISATATLRDNLTGSAVQGTVLPSLAPLVLTMLPPSYSFSVQINASVSTGPDVISWNLPGIVFTRDQGLPSIEASGALNFRFTAVAGPVILVTNGSSAAQPRGVTVRDAANQVVLFATSSNQNGQFTWFASLTPGAQYAVEVRTGNNVGAVGSLFVPTPAPVAMLTLAGLAVTRRRR